MIDSVAVTAFKSLAEAEISLGVLNVFVGPNGSGKSNLLEAIGVLGAAASGRVDDESLLRRGVRPGVPALYKTSFSGSRMKNAIQLEAKAGTLRYRVGLHNPSTAPKPAWSYKTESLATDEHTIFGRSPRSKEKFNQYSGLLALQSVEFKEGDAADRLTNDLQNYAIFSPNTATLRGLVTEQQPRDPVGLNGGRLAEAYRDLIRSPRRAAVSAARGRLVDWVDLIGVSEFQAPLASPSVSGPPVVLRFRDKYMAEGRNTLSALDASEGALYVLFSLALCFHHDAPNVLAIDNFDHALNPLLARRLTSEMSDWLLSEEQPRQVLLTAHNPLVLDGLPLNDDRVRLFTVGRSHRGRTVVRRIEVTERMQEMVDDEGWTISRMWTTGHLGGVPSV